MLVGNVRYLMDGQSASAEHHTTQPPAAAAGAHYTPNAGISCVLHIYVIRLLEVKYVVCVWKA